MNIVADKLQELLGQQDDPTIRAKTWDLYLAYVAEHMTHDAQTEKAGYYRRPHATTFTSFAGCNREIAFKALGYTSDSPPDWRGQNTFALGHMIEAWLKALLEQTNVPTFSGASFEVPGWVIDYESWHYPTKVHPDGLIILTPEQRDELVHCSPEGSMYPTQLMALEIKSISGNGFKYLRDTGVQAAKPAYYDQMQIEMKASGANCALLLVQCKNTGALLEQVVWQDDDAFDALTYTFNQVYLKEDPFLFPAPYSTERVCESFPGKVKGKKPAEERAAELGVEAYPNVSEKNGRTYGWKVPVGEKLGYPCAYCGFRKQCYGNSGYTLREDWSDEEDRYIVWAIPGE